jgi:enoyl-CoA hydratase/carnithine racemase
MLDEVLFETLACQRAGHAIGVVWLNRPSQINALNLGMCQAMLTQLRAWASDESIVAIVLAGKGAKGFSGGGDVAHVVREIRAGGAQRFVYGDSFFAVEYQLDLLIHEFPKPLVVWAHGVCMGGGVGLLAGGQVKIVSEQARIAMPEIHIGLHPDVGGAWFLNRMPGGSGMLMALTGLIVNEADALFTGLADYALPYAQQETYLSGLRELAWGETVVDHRAQLVHFTRQLVASNPLSLPESGLRYHFDVIQDMAARAKLSGFLKGLASAAQSIEYFRRPLENLQKGSPTAAAVIFEYLRRGKKMSIGQVLEMDLCIARYVQRTNDFPEGVRALLIDKDKKPTWQAVASEGVPQALIDAHFV